VQEAIKTYPVEISPELKARLEKAE
jgi:hypothetical protein